MKKLLLSIAIAAAVMSTGVLVFAAMGTTSGDGPTESDACRAAKDRAYSLKFAYCPGTDISVSSCNCSQGSNKRWSCFVEYGCKR